MTSPSLSKHTDTVEFSKETEPEWTHIYTSDIIVDKYPTKIELKYTQEENFSSGFYCFVIYDVRTEKVYGWEFYVYNTAEGLPEATVSSPDLTEHVRLCSV